MEQALIAFLDLLRGSVVEPVTHHEPVERCGAATTSAAATSAAAGRTYADIGRRGWDEKCKQQSSEEQRNRLEAHIPPLVVGDLMRDSLAR
jgi:hypothetical protein